MARRILLVLAFLAAAADAATAEEAQCARERAAMVEIIRGHAGQDTDLLPTGISTPVLTAMAAIERHRFIPNGDCSVGYVDSPVPIGHKSTISQPFIVALMTHLAAPASDHVSLEIGTGSGYQAAVLSRLVKTVCTIELLAPLAVTAAKVLNDLGHDNARVRVGDGYQGWPDCGPFDSIIVTAALEHIPPPLMEQLKVGGRLVMPLGYANRTQGLTVVEKLDGGKVNARIVTLVRFVPFVRPPN